MLWFDVEKKTITTGIHGSFDLLALWFDVEKKTITTLLGQIINPSGCGLM